MFEFLRRRPKPTTTSRTAELAAALELPTHRRGPGGMGQRRFDAAVVDRLTASWMASDVAINQELRGQLDLLRQRSRDLFKNNEYVVKFGRMVRNNVVGPEGPMLQVRATEADGKPDSMANRAIEKSWWRWMRPGNCEVSGHYSFQGVLWASVLSLARDGELLLRKVRGSGRGEFGYQLQILDVARLDTTLNRNASGTENAILMGVEVDQFHKPLFYHLWTSPPSIGSYKRERERVPASEIIHRFMPIEPEQVRGVPWLHAAMRRLNDLNGYREAAVIAARIGASKMGFYVSPDGAPPGHDSVDDQGNFIAQASPGEFGILPAGYDFREYNPAYPHDQFDAFCKAALRGIASGIGVSYNGLANDLEGVNFSSIRAGVLEEREEWMAIQNWLISAVLEPVYEEWFEAAMLGGRITLPNGTRLPIEKFEKFRAHEWQPRRWQWVDPRKDIEAAVMAIENRLASPQQIAAQAGRDVEDILNDIAAFNELAGTLNVPLKPLPGGAPAPAAADDDD